MMSLSTLKLNDNRLSFIKGNYFSNLTKLKELFLSNNQISSIQSNSINTLISLVTLDLSDNSIFALDPRLFYNLASLEKLYLQNNVIHAITNQTFIHARRLTDINLGYNLLTLLTPGLFFTLSNLKSLNLEKNPISRIILDCFANLTNLSSLKIANDIAHTTIIPFTTYQEQFLPKLDSIFFYKDKTNIIREFNLTNIRTISLDYCEIDLNISSQLMLNKIKKITMPNLFTDNKSINYFIGEFGLNLLEIDLSFNLIEFQRPNQFISKSLHLEKLWLAGVNITSFSSVLDLSVFSKLVLLDLSFNSLEIIKEHFFKFSFELRHLNLSHNQIRQVEDYSFFRNSKLVTLDLSSNKIEDLTDDVFAVVYYNLVHFHLNDNTLNTFSAEYRLLSLFYSIRLNNNNLAEFPTSIYFTVLNINDFDLSGNPIGILKPAFFLVTNRIFNLYLRNCSIHSIEGGTFQKVHTLLTLDLSYNQLKMLDKDIFCELEGVRRLDLSSNQVVFIQKELFEELNKLEVLVLENNQIQDIQTNAFVNLISLKMFLMHLNPIVDLIKNDTLVGLSRLKYMTVSNSINITFGIIQFIKDQIKLRVVRQVLDITFYDSINIAIVPNCETNYTNEMCFYISFLIRNQISFNLVDFDDSYRIKFIADCRSWSTDYYQATLN
jgi:Leucine-rich repeat (LRR) protein